MQVIFSNRAFTSILAETTEKIKTETGGLFLGKCVDDNWYVIEAIDPGPNSVFQVAYFEYDREYTEHLINKVANLYATKLDLIGLWHRHPGSMDYFSSTDDGTNSKYAKMNENGAISGLVNIDPKFRLTMYHVERPCNYNQIKYQVGDEYIPKELTAFKQIDEFEILMENLKKGKRNLPRLRKSISLFSFMRKIKPYLHTNVYDKRNQQFDPDSSALDELVDIFFSDISFMREKLQIVMTVKRSENGMEIVQDAVNGKVVINCNKERNKEFYYFEFQNETFEYTPSLFESAYRRYMAEAGGSKYGKLFR